MARPCAYKCVCGATYESTENNNSKATADNILCVILPSARLGVGAVIGFRVRPGSCAGCPYFLFTNFAVLKTDKTNKKKQTNRTQPPPTENMFHRAHCFVQQRTSSTDTSHCHPAGLPGARVFGALGKIISSAVAGSKYNIMSRPGG